MPRFEEIEDAGLRVELGDTGSIIRLLDAQGRSILIAPVKLTQAQYNALTPDPNTLYLIVG